MITNKPDPSEFTANIGGGLSSTSGGGTGYQVDGTVNIPLSDSVAIRLSGFSARDAGYIDSVLGTTVVAADYFPGSMAAVKERMRALLQTTSTKPNGWADAPPSGG